MPTAWDGERWKHFDKPDNSKAPFPDAPGNSFSPYIAAVLEFDEGENLTPTDTDYYSEVAIYGIEIIPNENDLLNPEGWTPETGVDYYTIFGLTCYTTWKHQLGEVYPDDPSWDPWED